MSYFLPLDLGNRFLSSVISRLYSVPVIWNVCRYPSLFIHALNKNSLPSGLWYWLNHIKNMTYVNAARNW